MRSDTVVDWIAAMAAAPAALVLRRIRRRGLQRLPATRGVLERIGVLPVIDHYYEPLIDSRHLHKALDAVRALPGIDLNTAAQLELLRSMRFQEELRSIPIRSDSELQYYYANSQFKHRDGAFWYSFLRLKKPRRILEVGSGFSTLAARQAIRANAQEDPGYACVHECIEPYEREWLERSGVVLQRKRLQDVPAAMFSSLGPGDVLFIDSSHVIRPQGDVVREYLEIVPTLAAGVIVHVHDIFTPRDYLKDWVVTRKRLWNEQYMVEALLSCSGRFEVVAALNHLYHDHRQALNEALPPIPDEREPSSFYFRIRADDSAAPGTQA